MLRLRRQALEWREVDGEVVALDLDRPHRRCEHAPGELRAGIRHPAALALALPAAVLVAVVALVMVST